MAKRKSGQNVSAAIREYAKQNPNAKPKAISEGLAASGVKVGAGYVSTVLSNERRKSGKGRRGKRRGAGGRGTGSDVFANLVLAKKLVDQFGSVEQAQNALSTLAKILD